MFLNNEATTIDLLQPCSAQPAERASNQLHHFVFAARANASRARSISGRWRSAQSASAVTGSISVLPSRVRS